MHNLILLYVLNFKTEVNYLLSNIITCILSINNILSNLRFGNLTFWNYVTYEFVNPESFLHKMVLGLISKQLLHPFHVYGHIMLKAPVLVRSLKLQHILQSQIFGF